MNDEYSIVCMSANYEAVVSDLFNNTIQKVSARKT